MRRIFLVFLLILWELAGTILMSRWWYANPDYFPHFSEKFWRRLDLIFGASNVDDAKNVEIFVVVTTSFLIVTILAAVAVVVIRYTKRKFLTIHSIRTR